MSAQKRGRRLATFGKRGSLVRLFDETRNGVRRYVVQYGPKGARKQATFPHTKDGKAEAEAFFAGFQRQKDAPAERVPLTNRHLWQAYLTAESEHLRVRSRQLYSESWRTWEQFAGAHNVAEDTTVQQIHEFRKSLDAQNLATATVYNTIRNVRIVFNWGERSELLEKNRWHLFVFKVSKEKRTKPRAEYRSEDFLAIWGALDPTRSGQWRAWVAIGLLGIYGNRQNEILNLQWSWIEGDVVHIPPEHVKTGEEGALTLFPLTRQLLDVARDWRARTGYEGPYVLFPGRRHNKEPHYTIQSLTTALHEAEKRAGVPQIRFRAGHGFRRGLVGDLAEETGDIMLALQAIRDKDIRMASRYRVRRNDRIDQAVRGRAERLVGEGATKVQPSLDENENGSQKEPLTVQGDT